MLTSAPWRFRKPDNEPLLRKETAGSAFKPVDKLTVVSPKEVSFDFPTGPANGKFKVRVLVGGVEGDTKNIE